MELIEVLKRDNRIFEILTTGSMTFCPQFGGERLTTMQSPSIENVRENKDRKHAHLLGNESVHRISAGVILTFVLVHQELGSRISRREKTNESRNIRRGLHIIHGDHFHKVSPLKPLLVL